MSQQYDLIVLGGGSAAFAAGIKASELGAKVAVVEAGVIGGTCLNRGCVPSKYLIHAAELFHQAHATPLPGLKPKGAVLDFAKLINGKEALLEEGRKYKYWEVLDYHKKITFIPKRGMFLSPQSIQVDGQVLKAPKFIVATGASPFIPPIEDIDTVPYLTSTEALNLKKLPKSMIVLGANAVGLELAQAYARFGTKVTIHEIAGRITPHEEPEVSATLDAYLREDGIEICTCSEAYKVRRDRGLIYLAAHMPNGKDRVFKAEAFLVATGRRPNTQGIGLDVAGVGVDKRGAVLVNDEMRTSAENIWAAGDVVNCACPSQFVYVAALQGAAAAQNAIDDCCHRKVDYRVIPRVIFTNPEVASVGLTEAQAKEKGLKVKTSALEFKWVPRAWLQRDTRGLIKMVAEEGTMKLLGVSMVAPHAGEIIHEAAMALKFQATVQDIIDTLHGYPTLSEALKICAQGFFKDATKLSCCAE